MKNIPIETDEWLIKLERAWKRIEALLPDDVAAALVIANKVQDGEAHLKVYANTCEHGSASLLACAANSLGAVTAAHNHAECVELGPMPPLEENSQN